MFLEFLDAFRSKNTIINFPIHRFNVALTSFLFNGSQQLTLMFVCLKALHIRTMLVMRSALHFGQNMGINQWCTTCGPRVTSGPRRVFMWPAVSNRKSDYFKPIHLI